MPASSNYLSKLIASGDFQASILVGGLTSEIPSLPTGNNQCLYDEYDAKQAELSGKKAAVEKQLNKMGLFSSLLTGAYQNEVGVKGEQHVSMKNINLTTTDVKWEKETYKQVGGKVTEQETESMFSQITNSSNKADTKEAKIRIQQLEEERAEYSKNFLQGAAVDVSGYIHPLFKEAVELTFSLTEDSNVPEASMQILDKAGDWAVEDSTGGQQVKSWTGKFIDHVRDTIRIEAEIENEKKKMFNHIFDVGGFYSSNTGETEGGFVRNSIYDLETQLQIDDLNKNGFRGYVYRMSGGNVDAVINFDESIGDYQLTDKSGGTEETIKEYIQHSDSAISLADLDMDELDASLKKVSDLFESKSDLSVVDPKWFSDAYYDNHGAIKSSEGAYR